MAMGQWVWSNETKRLSMGWFVWSTNMRLQAKSHGYGEMGQGQWASSMEQRT